VGASETPASLSRFHGRGDRYVCQTCGYAVADTEAVRRRLALNKAFIYCQQCDARVELIDHIEQRLATDPVARRVLSMDRTATSELSAQALEQILIGHMMAICGEANQIFRPVSMFDYGIDGELEFRGDDGQPSGRKIYVQLKSGESYIRTHKDGKEIVEIRNERHLDYWVNQPVDVFLVIRDGAQTIRWMNVTETLRKPTEKKNRRLIFDGRRLDARAVWLGRDEYLRKSL
jgi:hypothetical protein